MRGLPRVIRLDVKSKDLHELDERIHERWKHHDMDMQVEAGFLLEVMFQKWMLERHEVELRDPEDVTGTPDFFWNKLAIDCKAKPFHKSRQHWPKVHIYEKDAEKLFKAEATIIFGACSFSGPAPNIWNWHQCLLLGCMDAGQFLKEAHKIEAGQTWKDGKEEVSLSFPSYVLHADALPDLNSWVIGMKGPHHK